MKERRTVGRAIVTNPDDYRLEAQVGFLLRRANQRHLAIFSRGIRDLTPTQFAALAKLHEHGPMSQNDLGRRTAMDAATMKGVIDRLSRKGLVQTRADQQDLRRVIAELTAEGRAAIAAAIPAARGITRETLAPLSDQERITLAELLLKLARPGSTD